MTIATTTSESLQHTVATAAENISWHVIDKGPQFGTILIENKQVTCYSIAYDGLACIVLTENHGLYRIDENGHASPFDPSGINPFFHDQLCGKLAAIQPGRN